MATIQTDAVKAGNCPDRQDGSVNASWGEWTYNDDGGGAIDDVIQMVNIPKGAKLIDILVEWSDGFAGSSTFDVGDGDNDDRFYAAIDNSTNDGRMSLAGGQKGGAVAEGPNVSMAGYGYVYAAADTMDITVEGAVAAAGDKFTMCVLYTVEGGFDDD